MEPASILAAARRRWWLIVVLAALGGLLGALPSSSESADATTSYTAAHTLLLSTTSVGDSVFNDPVSFNQLQLFAVTGEVPRRVAEKLDYPDVPAALAAQVIVTIDNTNAALRISTTQPTPEAAVEIADSFADELVTYLAERQDELKAARLAASKQRQDALEADIKVLEPAVAADPDDAVAVAQLSALQAQYEAEFGAYRRLETEESSLQLTTLERAQPLKVTEAGLSAPKSRTGRGLLAGIVGALAGLGVAIVWARADRRLRSKAQAEDLVGLRSQVDIPLVKHLGDDAIVVVPGRHDSLSDAYRTLRSVIGFVEASIEPKAGGAPVILVISSGPGDGKTSVSVNLAAAFVESGHQTVAVNTDFRRPTLSQRVLGRPAAGIGFFAADVRDLPVSILVDRSSIDGLHSFDLAGAIGSPGDLARMTARMLPALSQEFEAVVVDTSPVGATAEVLEVVPLADVIVLVVRLDHSYIESIRRTLEIVRALTAAPMILTVVGEVADRPDYREYGSRPTAKPRPRRGRAVKSRT